TPAEAMAPVAERIASAERVGILFGRERIGLTNEEISFADAILTFPVNPAFASLNLAQAVLLVGYEWFKATGGEPPFRETHL
ncbi:MAG: TrmH family RNA methyltransferase, partial [Hyphomicrobiales bacterium]